MGVGKAYGNGNGNGNGKSIDKANGSTTAMRTWHSREQGF